MTVRSSYASQAMCLSCPPGMMPGWSETKMSWSSTSRGWWITRGKPPDSNRRTSGISASTREAGATPASISIDELSHLSCGEVPGADHADLSLVAEHPDRGGPQGEEPPLGRHEPKPAGGEDPQEVAVRKEGDVAFGLHRLPDYPVGAATHLRGRFPARDLAVPDRPSGRLELNLGRGSTLVVAVVPFPEVILHPGDIPVPGQAARLPGPGKRTRQDEGEAPAAEPPTERHRLPLAGDREGGIRAPGVPPPPAPIGLAVPDDPYVGSSLVHRLPGSLERNGDFRRDGCEPDVPDGNRIASNGRQERGEGTEREKIAILQCLPLAFQRFGDPEHGVEGIIQYIGPLSPADHGPGMVDHLDLHAGKLLDGLRCRGQGKGIAQNAQSGADVDRQQARTVRFRLRIEDQVGKFDERTDLLQGLQGLQRTPGRHGPGGIS